MTEIQYTEPVSKLLACGGALLDEEWIDYLALGITSNHIPELARMSLDEKLWEEDSDGDEVWAPLHAWRALGQLRDPAAIPTLLAVMDMSEEWDDDWSGAEPPAIFAMIGEPSVEPLNEFLCDANRTNTGHMTAAESLKKIAEQNPQCRERCVQILRERLLERGDYDRFTIAIFVSCLVDLNATEAVPEIEAAFAANMVDISFMGDWEEVQIRMGLLDERVTPPPVDGWFLAELEKKRQSLAGLREKIDAFNSTIEHRKELRRADDQRAKRNKLKKQAKQTKKKQRKAKKKRKK